MQQVATNRDSAELRQPIDLPRTQQVEDFTVTLEKCEGRSSVVTCKLAVKNNGPECGFNITSDQSILVDDLGRAVNGLWAKMDNAVEVTAGSRMLRGASLPASLTFGYVSENATKVTRLIIKLSLTVPRPVRLLEFRNIPLEATPADPTPTPAKAATLTKGASRSR